MRISHDDTDDRFPKPDVAAVSGQRTFAMFCTWKPPDVGEWPVCYLFAEVADEIAAVEAFRSHVANWGDGHIPCIHMEPMRAEWRVDSYLKQDEIDAAANLFRHPAEVSSDG